MMMTVLDMLNSGVMSGNVSRDRAKTFLSGYAAKMAAMVLCVALCLGMTTSVFAENRMDNRTMKKASFGTVENPNAHTHARLCYKTKRNVKVDLSSYKLDDSLRYVHPMWYIMSVKKTMTAKSADDTPSSVKVKKGTDVVVLHYAKKSVCRLKGGRTVIIPKSKLKWKWHVYNTGATYADSQIESWVNSHGITSKTNYVFAVSRYNQRGWIMERTSAGWRCKYVMKVCTVAHTPQEYGKNTCSINAHYKYRRDVGGLGISYVSSAGGNLIHIAGKSYIGHPHTHGCIALLRKDLNFVYYYLPIGTRVLTI